MRIIHYNDEETELHAFLSERGHTNVIIAADGDPWSVVADNWFDAAFVGLHPHGLELIRALHQRNPGCFVTIITSDRDTRMAVEAMRRGAFDYLLSPLDFAEVERTTIMIGREHEMLLQQRRLKSELDAAVGAGRLLGNSRVMRNLRRLIGKAASSLAPVLITGETGTGKELVARLLHEQSPRHPHPMVSVNCSAIPSTLLESELFGYHKGAFTGAHSDRLGLLASASGGTFLFDEISDLDLSLQGKILRVLQQSEVVPLGSTTPQALDVRFIAATNRDLGQLVADGLFREDLFYRLNVVPIYVPPLRERTEDIAELVCHFLERYSQRDGRETLKVAPTVWQWLGNHSWPGNVRELENLCQRAVALAEGSTFDAKVLSLSETLSAQSTRVTAGVTGSANTWSASRRQFERQLIEQALLDHGGVVSRAARALDISRTTLYARIKEMGIDLRRDSPRRALRQLSPGPR